MELYTHARHARATSATGARCDGADQFVFTRRRRRQYRPGYDPVADFVTGSDKLDFTASAISAANVAILAAGDFTSAVHADTDASSSATSLWW